MRRRSHRGFIKEEAKPLVHCNNDESLPGRLSSTTALELNCSASDNKENCVRPSTTDSKELEERGENDGRSRVLGVKAVCGSADDDVCKRPYRRSDFTLGSLLGKGKYGCVYAARDRVRNRDVALKVIISSNSAIDGGHAVQVIRLDSNEGRYVVTKQLQREIQIQRNISHPNIIRLYGFFIFQQDLYLVLEYASSGSLFDFLQKNGPLNETSVAKCIKALAVAVHHLHVHGVIHRDIKPENVLIGEDGEMKLGDFGWSVLCCKGRRKTLCGTLDYLAPEMLTQKGHDHRVDIWGLGVLCYELLFGNPPFLTDNFADTASHIKAVEFSFPISPQTSSHAQDFIKQILVSDLKERLDLKGILQHPFIQRSE